MTKFRKHVVELPPPEMETCRRQLPGLIHSPAWPFRASAGGRELEVAIRTTRMAAIHPPRGCPFQGREHA
jgi:hypothetical protein